MVFRNSEQGIPLLSSWARAWSTTPAATQRSSTHGPAPIVRAVDSSITETEAAGYRIIIIYC
jgi:hypothetical protein